MIRCDSRYDGSFYYAVKTTGIYCRPSCKSKPPHRRNITYFRTREEARQEGYRPCKRCRPDLFTPYEPVPDLIRDVKLLLEREYQNQWTLRQLSARFSVSPSHLQRLFKEHEGISPKQYLTDIRIQKAQQLLLTGEQNNLQISLEVGFNTPDRFYLAFRRRMGVSPSTFRRLRGQV